MKSLFVIFRPYRLLVDRRWLAFLLLAAAIILPARPARAAFALYVSSNKNNAIYKFNTNGLATLFATNGVNGVLDVPLGLALDNLGGLYVFNDTGGTVEKYDPLGNGALFANTPAGDGTYGAAMDVSNNLYVANITANDILKITNPGGQVSVFAPYSASTLNGPAGMAFDSTGNLFVANNSGGWIEKFDRQGNGTRFATMTAPTGLAFDSAGNLYVSEDSTGVIEKFAYGQTNGTTFASVPAIDEPYGMAFDTAGNLYVACVGNNTIERFDPLGNPTVFATAATGLKGPAFIVIQETRYQDNWFKAAAGGGTSTNGEFVINGTIGQQDAGTVMNGGEYGMVGGFWGRISVVLTPGAPLLKVTHSGNQAIISWPTTVTGWTLQTNLNLATGAWGNYAGTIANNSVTNSPPVGNLFFRLTQP